MLAEWAPYFIEKDGRKNAPEKKASETDLCICWAKETRYYNVFKSLGDFINFFRKQKDKNFFELIRDIPQKIYFDIDIKGDKLEMGKNIVYNLIHASIKVSQQFNNPLTPDDFIIFDSNGKDSKNRDRVSYHIITYRHRVNGCIANRIFFNEVIKLIPDEEKEYIDDSMYSKLQQFRTFYSSKPNDSRVKKFNETFRQRDLCITHEYPKNIKTKFLRFYYIMEKSLITMNRNCKDICIPRPEKADNYGDFSSEKLTEEDVAEILNRVGKQYYSLRGVVNNIVVFNYVKKVTCMICKRIHNTDHPYVTVINGKIHFRCRKNKDKSVSLGYLKRYLVIKDNPEDTVSEEESLELKRSGSHAAVFSRMLND